MAVAMQPKRGRTDADYEQMTALLLGGLANIAQNTLDKDSKEIAQDALKEALLVYDGFLSPKGAFVWDTEFFIRMARRTQSRSLIHTQCAEGKRGG